MPYRPRCLPVAEEYEGKNKVKVKAMGSGAGLSEHISDDEVIFGGLRTKEGKFLCLMCASFLQGVFFGRNCRKSLWEAGVNVKLAGNMIVAAILISSARPSRHCHAEFRKSPV